MTFSTPIAAKALRIRMCSAQLEASLQDEITEFLENNPSREILGIDFGHDGTSYWAAVAYR